MTPEAFQPPRENAASILHDLGGERPDTLTPETALMVLEGFVERAATWVRNSPEETREALLAFLSRHCSNFAIRYTSDGQVWISWMWKHLPRKEQYIAGETGGHTERYAREMDALRAAARIIEDSPFYRAADAA